MDKQQILDRYKILGSKLYKNNNKLQLKFLKECMDIIENSFDPYFDGRHALVQKLNSVNEQYMQNESPKQREVCHGAMCIIAACIALFQKGAASELSEVG